MVRSLAAVEFHGGDWFRIFPTSPYRDRLDAETILEHTKITKQWNIAGSVPGTPSRWTRLGHYTTNMTHRYSLSYSPALAKQC